MWNVVLTIPHYSIALTMIADDYRGSDGYKRYIFCFTLNHNLFTKPHHVALKLNQVGFVS